ncbi:hypothetical protein AK812_SmicGene12282 [Symbiodinium microadriaticum]|uniref:CHK kinase-like domain-containing protein n=1 Tax=Symbiodinium microadriaticum TaxID=2951 RepID=A0A1Q9EB28_SYMMI|nr:hypothetical protein AK812_SmicGene12282 [Symbiodinium microadriaticum]
MLRLCFPLSCASSSTSAGSDAGGLQLQGCYWHLDTRPDEHRKMPSSGWMGRLKLGARAIDLRLKADPLQSVCHGDAKGANILYASGEGGEVMPLVYDFQYCGKAAVTKDLAYFFNVEAQPSEAEEERLLRLYHSELTKLLGAQGDVPPELAALKTSLELALCDWRRFSEIGLGGWGDDARHRVQKVLDRLDGGRALPNEEAYIDAMQREYPASRNSRLRSLTPPTQREAERVAATNDDADGSSDSEVLELVETVRNRATTWSHEAHKSIMEKLGIQLHEGADVSSPRATFQVRRSSCRLKRSLVLVCGHFAAFLEAMSRPDPAKSDFAKMGMEKTNFMVVFPIMQLVFSLPGIIGAFVAIRQSPFVQGRVESIATMSAGPLYLSVFFMRITLGLMQASLGNARRDSGINVPDQHAYKVVGGTADGTLVLMDDTEPFGRFNRAQRAVQNHMEQVFPMVLEFFLSGYVFPWTTAALASGWAGLRCWGALSYADDRMARIKGNLPSNVFLGSMAGIVVTTGVFASLK